MVVPSFDVTVCIMVLLRLFDARQYGLVSTAVGIHPCTRIDVAVGTPCPFVIGWRTLFATPNDERFIVHFIGIFKRVRRIPEPVRFDILARLFCPEWQFITNDLNSLNRTPTMDEI